MQVIAEWFSIFCHLRAFFFLLSLMSPVTFNLGMPTLLSWPSTSKFTIINLPTNFSSRGPILRFGGTSTVPCELPHCFRKFLTMIIIFLNIFSAFRSSPADPDAVGWGYDLRVREWRGGVWGSRSSGLHNGRIRLVLLLDQARLGYRRCKLYHTPYSIQPMETPSSVILGRMTTLKVTTLQTDLAIYSYFETL